MMRFLELELSTYDRQRARLEDEHPGKFVLIRGEEIAGIFDDFQSASEYAAHRLQRQAYLIQGIGMARTRIPSGLLAGLATVFFGGGLLTGGVTSAFTSAAALGYVTIVPLWAFLMARLLGGLSRS